MKLHVLVAAAVLVGAGSAAAHPSISSGPAAANKSQKITMSIGHGCDGLDTARVEVVIPAGITSVRALRSDFGKPALARTGDVVTSITWQKPDAERLAADDGYYELVFRARVPDVPFQTILFTVHQTCIAADGTPVVVSWDQPPEVPDGNHAAALAVVPARQSGWNRYVLGAATTIAEADVPKYLGDALIVWRGSSAYSANANTYAQIAATAGVTPLTGDLRPGDELWVKY